MSVAYFIVAEREIPGFDDFVDGKSIAHEAEGTIESFCKKLGVRALTEFLSQSQDDLIDFMEGEGVEGPDGLPAEEWFTASDGLETVRAMRKALEVGDSPFKGTADVIEDLKDYERVLARLHAENVRWHLQLDF